MESGLLAIVGRVEHKASAGFDRAAKMHRPQIGDGARFDVELREQLAQGQRGQLFVDDEPHCTCFVAVSAEIDDRPGKPRIRHLWHRHQELTCKRFHCALRATSPLPPRGAAPIRLYSDLVASSSTKTPPRRSR